MNIHTSKLNIVLKLFLLLITVSNISYSQPKLITKVGFSTTPDNIYNQNMDATWANPTFQAQTRFGNVLRLSVWKDLTTIQKNNLRITIDSSLKINRQIILLVPIEIEPLHLKVQLSFLNDYFLSNKIQWFELTNEPWAYYYNLGYSAQASDTAYMKRVKKYVKTIKDSINSSAKFIVASWEANAADWNNTAGNFRWTKELLDSLYLQQPITPIDAISFHLYSNRYNNGVVSPNRLLSTGMSLDTGYISAFSFSYNSYNGLIELLKAAIGGRNIEIFCTEYNQVPDLPQISSFRRSIGNALLFANTFCYLSKNQVRTFAFHQLGKDYTSSPDPLYSGYNCINNAGNNIPISFAIKMLSLMKDTITKMTFDKSFSFNTYGSAWNTSMGRLNDSTGSLDSITGIPYITTITSKSRDTLTLCIVNMSSSNVLGLLNIDTSYNTFKILTMNSNNLLDNNDASEQIKPVEQNIFHTNLIDVPKYSIIVLIATKTVSNIINQNEIALSYSLKQNYPNPFNPLTNIELSIPEKTFVQLIMYSVDGREIMKLISKELNQGNYKYQLNAEQFPSGTYFYKIMTSKFQQTRKMILVK